MKNTNRISTIRAAYSIAIILSFVIGPLVLGFISKMEIDLLICMMAISICFGLVFVLGLINRRLKDKLKETIYVSYGKICFTTIVCFIVVILCGLYAPDFFAPIMVIPLLLNTVLDASLSVAFSIYAVSILSLSQGYGSYEILCYMLLVCFGVVVADFLLQSQLEKLFDYILILAINVLLSTVFYYFNYLEMNSNVLVYCIVDSVIILIVCSILVPFLSKYVQNAQTEIYDTILETEYDLHEDIRKFSYYEYQHSLRVSRLSRICAHEINANEKLAACGGFYYRLGKMLGEPMIDNAVRVANNHCFPEDLIQIITEYGGILAFPTTKESAIVHMVDTVVTKVELFDSDSMSSTWNKNMVIYQTINELSQNGFYDDSGLSMNQFLKIRERLVNEDIL